MAVGVSMSNYGVSEQHIFDALKSISRNKQHRISSVAHEIITKHDRAWLTHNITMQKRYDIIANFRKGNAKFCSPFPLYYSPYYSNQLLL
jgi:hypothetical protein